jgi:phosphoglycolate phosphatase-like HAD superfamily hydrolase
MQAATAAGLYAVGVTWGAIHEPDRLAGADVVVDTPDELLDVL